MLDDASILVPVDPAVAQVWIDFWLPLVSVDSEISLEQIKRELYDYHQIMGEVARVYDHVTGGRISKINTQAVHVIQAADDYYEQTYADEASEAKEFAADA